jgi:hypothetical protein
MDNREAIRWLEQELDAWRQRPYAELSRLIDLDPVVSERNGDDGTKYQLEIQAVWDGPRAGNIRVIGSIDDGRWRAFLPLTRSFIKTPDDAFVET